MLICFEQTEQTEQIPKPGEWPVDPQEDVPVRDDRVWVDGCFDFTHHGTFTLQAGDKFRSDGRSTRIVSCDVHDTLDHMTDIGPH